VKHADDEPPFGVSRETEERLRAYVDLLLQWNRRINLVSARSAEDVWRRHVVDSLQLLPLLPARLRPVLDIGSGAGFPGWCSRRRRPAGRLWRPKRKAAFLVEASPARPPKVGSDAEQVEDAWPPKTPLLTARAWPPARCSARPRLLSPGRHSALVSERADSRGGIDGGLPRLDDEGGAVPEPHRPISTILRISEIRPAGSEA
jgi:16S rRNA (guanine527-N7)-methyltransferase